MWARAELKNASCSGRGVGGGRRTRRAQRIAAGVKSTQTKSICACQTPGGGEAGGVGKWAACGEAEAETETGVARGRRLACAAHYAAPLMCSKPTKAPAAAAPAAAAAAAATRALSAPALPDYNRDNMHTHTDTHTI